MISMHSRPSLWLLILLLGGLAGIAEGADYGKLRSLALEVRPEVEPLALRVEWLGIAGLGDFRLEILDAAGKATQVVISKDSGVPDGEGNTVFHYRDPAVALGEGKEYRVMAYSETGGKSAFGHALGGIELPLHDARGSLFLAVAANQAAPLETELTRLVGDLHREGWTVHRQDFALDASPAAIKDAIRAMHAGDPHLNTVFLFGDLAVPYAGLTAPDGHVDHYGAWPADVYYGDLEGSWTDVAVNTTAPSGTRNDNVPGDGKFDQSTVRTEVSLAVGRVDLADLPAFAPLTETDLLRRYLDKNHAFRRGILVYPNQALFDDHFASLKEGVAAGARRGFPTIVGRGAVHDLAWPHAVANEGYLLGYGAGAGSFHSISGIGSATSLAQESHRVAFGFFFGSYLGDFDSSNNFLRSFLATEDGGLIACWSARPHWPNYRMALGDSTGDMMRAVFNQRRSATYDAGLLQGGVHAALLGDPTLSLHPIAPPANLVATASGNQVELAWTASPRGDVRGYHVYRAVDANGPFVRITDSLVEATTFLHDAPAGVSATYMVRAVGLLETASGSYWHASPGTLATLTEGHNVSASSTYEDWVHRFFGHAPSDGDSSIADADADGIADLVEYAVGTNPTAPGDLPLSFSLIDSTLSFQEHADAHDATIICEMSDDLTNWVPVAYTARRESTLFTGADGMEVRLVTLDLTEVPTGRCCFRIRVDR